MSVPIVFISNQKIKSGKFEAYKQHIQQTVELIKANKPCTVAHLAFSDEDGTNASIVHVFPDAESLEFHLQGADELAEKAFELMEIVASIFTGDLPTQFWRTCNRSQVLVLL